MRVHVRYGWVVADFAIAPATALAQARLAPGDRSAIVAELDRMAATARHAWVTRNASVLVPDSSPGVRTADGRTLSATQTRADLQRRMDITTRVDTLIEALDSVRLVRVDSVLTYSSQRFVGVVRFDGRPERVLVSTVIHERSFVRNSGRWQLTGAVREIAPQTRWVDETPAGIAAAADSLRTLDSAWARTYATNDTALAAALLADRLFMTSSDGRVKDKAAEMADIRPTADGHMHHVRIEMFSGAGVVIGVADWAFTYRGQRTALRRRYAAVYVRGGPLGWQLVGLHMGPAL